MNNKDFIDFYCSNGKNVDNLSFYDILGFSNSEMESRHNWVQWAFPTLTISAYNKNVPFLSKRNWQILRKNFEAKTRFYSVLNKTLKFLGITTGYNYEIISIEYKDWFFNRTDHNRLRITRIIESCVLFGRRDIAISIFKLFLNLSRENPHNFTFENLYHWYNAAHNTKIL